MINLRLRVVKAPVLLAVTARLIFVVSPALLPVIVDIPTLLAVIGRLAWLARIGKVRFAKPTALLAVVGRLCDTLVVRFMHCSISFRELLPYPYDFSSSSLRISKVFLMNGSMLSLFPSLALDRGSPAESSDRSCLSSIILYVLTFRALPLELTVISGLNPEHSINFLYLSYDLL